VTEEHERWRIAFERCDEGSCCRANAKYHRPHCPRRAAHMAERRERWNPQMEAVSEIGGARGCLRGFAVALLIVVLVGALCWWVVYW
jgi:hypothetical protein